MNPEDLIEEGLILDTDLDGGPPKEDVSKLEPIGRYVLLEELGRGGSGVVYRARDPLLNRDVALKRLRSGDSELESRFLREAELLALLSHAGIMPIFDFGRESGAAFFTMPLATGPSLDRWIAAKRPEPREAARILRQAAEALAHAHERGVLHRDVKSANIMLSAEGDARLADFGLGRMEGKPRVTATGDIMGTPGYMAPEFASGDLKSVDARCDIYGLGATLYEALTGRPPHVGSSSLETLNRAIYQEPEPPRKLAPGTPVELETICLKALEKDPSRRYATAREMAHDLGRFLDGEPIQARRPSAIFRVRRFVGRRRALVVVAMAGVVAAAGVGLFAAWRSNEERGRRRKVADILEKAGRHAVAINDLLRTRSESDPEVEKQSKLAFEEIGKAMAVDPDSADALFLKGRIHSLRFEREEARRHYEAAIRKGPVARAHLERALIDSQDLFVLRADSLKAGIRRDLDDFMTLTADAAELEFAKALLEMSRLDSEGFEAAARLLRDYADRSRDWRAFCFRGVAEIECGRFDPARESLEQALELRQRTRASAFILDRLGVVFGMLDKPDEAERRLRLAVELDPGFVEAKVHLAGVCLELDKAGDAIKWSEAALAAEPSSVTAHAVRGQGYVMKHMSGKFDGDGRHLLRSAKESLEAARRGYAPDSEQGVELKKDWDYVMRRIDY